jgi:YesN/AraC family two-component response regulator
MTMPLLQLTVPPMPHYLIGGFTTPTHPFKHPNRRNIQVFDLLVVTKGCLYMGEEDQYFEVSAEQALILRPDSYHYSTKACLEETSFYWLHFQTTGRWSFSEPISSNQLEADHDLASPLKQFTTQTFTIQLPQFTKLLQPLKMYEILQQLNLLNQNNHLSDIRWKQQLLFQEVLQQLSATIEKHNFTPAKACAEQAALYLRQHYREAISARTLGDSLNFHPVYIARCMQKEFSCSPSEYLLRFRVEQAKVLLMQTDLPIALIAEEVGFNHAAYFTSCFTQCEGISPRKYRQRFSNGQ